MPPKPKASVRKNSRASTTSKPDGASDTKSTTTMAKDAASVAMPPPPVPAPPAGILEPEFKALSESLKNALIKSGQIYRFYSDTAKLGITNHAPNPPRSLTAGLGREIERYNQLLDAVEAQVLRAITVIQRDLKREQQILDQRCLEQQRLLEEQRLAEQKRIEEEATAISSRTRARSKSASVSPTLTRLPLPSTSPPNEHASVMLPPPPNPADSMPPPSSSGDSAAHVISPTLSESSTATARARRPSTISLSTLSRPAFPLRLDLSSSAMRMPTDDLMFSSGLASPVTLAPKSARPMTAEREIPDFMALAMNSAQSMSGVDMDMSAGAGVGDRHVDIDLTMPSPMIGATGGSADKPIELDLENMGDIDMVDLFGDDTSATAGPSRQGTIEASEKKEDVDLEKELLDVLTSDAAVGTKSHEGANITDTNLVPSPSSILASLGGGGADNAGVTSNDAQASSLFNGSEDPFGSNTVTDNFVAASGAGDGSTSATTDSMDPFSMNMSMGFDAVDFSSFLDNNNNSNIGTGDQAEGMFGMDNMDLDMGGMDMGSMDFGDMSSMAGFLDVGGSSGGGGDGEMGEENKE